MSSKRLYCLFTMLRWITLCLQSVKELCTLLCSRVKQHSSAHSIIACKRWMLTPVLGQTELWHGEHLVQGWPTCLAL